MTESNDWLIKPDTYRALQNIRKRIRSVYGDDIRITSLADVEALFRYRDDKDKTLCAMLLDFERRAPVNFTGGAASAHRADGEGANSLKVYRGQVVG